MPRESGFLKPGEILIHEGETDDYCYWITKGELVVSTEINGIRTILGNLGTGDLVGEMSFIDDSPRSCTVTASTECQFMKLHRKDFEEMVEAQPKWVKKIIRSLSERLKRTNNNNN